MKKEHEDHTDLRSHARFTVNMATKLQIGDQLLYSTIKDISFGGCKLQFSLDPGFLDLRKLESVIVPGIGEINATIVWLSHNYAGIKFNHSSITDRLTKKFIQDKGFENQGPKQRR